MRTVPFRTVLEAACGLIGQPYDGTATSQVTALVAFLNLKMQEFWTWGPWPEWTLTEERTPSTDKLVEWEASGENKIGRVFWVGNLDPRVNTNCRSWEWIETPDGIVLPAWASGTIWLQFQKPAPTYSATVFSVGAAYQRYDVVFYPGTEVSTLFPSRGECYVAELDEDGNQVWSLVQFPAILANPIALATAGWMQRMYGKAEQAEKLEDQAIIALSNEARKAGITAKMKVRAT